MIHKKNKIQIKRNIRVWAYKRLKDEQKKKKQNLEHWKMRSTAPSKKKSEICGNMNIYFTSIIKSIKVIRRIYFPLPLLHHNKIFEFELMQNHFPFQFIRNVLIASDMMKLQNSDDIAF